MVVTVVMSKLQGQFVGYTPLTVYGVYQGLIIQIGRFTRVLAPGICEFLFW